jgi:type IV fimbrial biogenesis protein FimT
MFIRGHGTGFTVLELMVTLSIASILLVAGGPALRTFSENQQMKAALNSLQNDLLMGRSEAVHRNMRVVACPGTPEEGCTGSNEWNNGWIVFADENADRHKQSAEPLVRRGHGPENLVIRSSPGRTDVRFHPDGSAPGSNGSITFCGTGGPERARKLVISNLGRIRRDDAAGTDAANCPS